MALTLAASERAKAWLRQFREEDVATARRLLMGLTLISHSAFERALMKLILERASTVSGPVALFATREIKPEAPLFEENKKVDAIGRGADVGSEARVAQLIRNLSRADSYKYLNHPTLIEMRDAQVRSIILVDDIVGSGKRTSDFVDELWRYPTIRSWHSLGLVRFQSVSFCGTEMGVERIRECRPTVDVTFVRDCPTFDNIPWTDDLREAVRSLCSRYGKLTSRPRMALGFNKTMASLAFEHGAPNNMPAILWSPSRKKGKWEPLFPERTVLSFEASSFPPEVTSRDAQTVLSEAGQERLAKALSWTKPRPLSRDVFVTLGLIRAGMRSRAAIGYATGFTTAECMKLIAECERANLITARMSLTAAGRAELAYMAAETDKKIGLPPLGEDSYYPQQLRRPKDS